ncbi:MAG: YdcF family protein [Eubacterium sp.]|nr:YdcF family protein [Eubacterium sp.]
MTYKKEIILIISVFLGLTVFGTVFVMNSAKTYIAHVYLPDGDYRDISIYTKGSGSVDITEISREGRMLRLLLDNGREGDAEIHVRCIHTESSIHDDEVVTGVTISKYGTIFYGPDSDFNGHQMLSGLASLFFLFVGALMFINYRKRRAVSIFSYPSLVRLCLSVYFSLQGVLYAGLCIGGIILAGRLTAKMTFIISGLALSIVILVLTPFIMINALIMTISNFALIKHESFRFSNVLGLIISGMMLAGTITTLVLVLMTPGSLDVSNDDIAVILARSVISPVYMYLLCVFGVSVYAMIRAARHEPSYDKDYIIILGCRIRKDGTLYPLLRGRTDRAVEFYKKQEEKTGKRAVFVPSGGKGADEPVSEGEAIENYLKGIGIPDEQIMAETKAKTTYENMKFSKELIDREKKDPKIIFSTTRYHVFRSGMIAEEAGMHAEGIGSKTKWYFTPNAQVREFIGLMAGQWKLHLTIIILLIENSVVLTFAPMLV